MQSPSSKFQETATYFIEYSANDLIDEIVDEITDDVLSIIYDCSISYSSIIAKEGDIRVFYNKSSYDLFIEFPKFFKIKF